MKGFGLWCLFKVTWESSLLNRTNVFLLLAGLFVLTAPSLPTAFAAPHTKEECGALRAQRQDLEHKGLGQTVLKGAKWASENLNAEEIGEVGVFLSLLENIRFRCGKTVKDAKSKFGLQNTVPLPARNPRRAQKKAAEAKKSLVTVESTGKMPTETKAVISAVTDGNESKASGASKNGAVPSMRKALEE